MQEIFLKEREKVFYVIVAPGSAVIWLVTNTATLYSARENNAKKVDYIQLEFQNILSSMVKARLLLKHFKFQMNEKKIFFMTDGCS